MTLEKNLPAPSIKHVTVSPIKHVTASPIKHVPASPITHVISTEATDSFIVRCAVERPLHFSSVTRSTASSRSPQVTA